MDFGAVASELKLQKDGALLTQAKQFWDMLDDMAASNPAAYDAFIAKQMEERTKLLGELAPPTPHFAVEVNESSGAAIGINLSSSMKLKEPDPSSNAIPIALNPAFAFKSGASSLKVYEAIFHPTVLEQASKSTSFKECIIVLAIESVERKFGLKLSQQFKVVSAYQKDEPKLAAPTGPAGGPAPAAAPITLETLLSAIHGEGGDSSPSVPTQPGQLPTKPAPSAAPKIEEISTDESSLLPKPQYSINQEKGVLTITVHLPGVNSVGEIDLDVSELDLSLLVPQQYSLLVKFPCKVDDAGVKAAFNKQFNMLAITVPVL